MATSATVRVATCRLGRQNVSHGQIDPQADVRFCLKNRWPHPDAPHQQRSTTMQDPTDATPQASRREPWNKGKLIGAKPSLRPKHVWSIRTKLQIAVRTRDLAMFNLAIDTKLRRCDVARFKVDDVPPHGHAVDRATIRRKKTIQPHG